MIGVGIQLTAVGAAVIGFGVWAWHGFPLPDLSGWHNVVRTGDGTKFDDGKAANVPALTLPVRGGSNTSVINGRPALITLEK